MNLDLVRRRAGLCEQIRHFFRERDFLEVETPLVASEAIPERSIELIRAGHDQWLQASPEMHHKRLLCAGADAILEITKSFRGHERGRYHNPEFTIVEWYQTGDTLSEGMALLDELFQSVAETSPVRRTTYREAFQGTLGIDPHLASDKDLRELAILHGVEEASEERDESLNALLALVVEPTLGIESPEMLYHYPASQAALAATAHDDQGVLVAERFELYWRGVELANGYHELTDAIELRRRLKLANDQRAAAGLPQLPMPELLLADMVSPGLPPCTGVALGFDRLVMLATGAETISEVRLFCEDDSA